MVGREVDGHEGAPHNARAVHGEGDVLGLVEVLRDVARLEGVDGAQHDEEHVVEERDHGGHLAGTALHHQGVPVEQVELGGRLLEAQPGEAAHHLHGHQAGADEDLGAGRGVAGPLDHGLDAHVEDAVDAVGLGQQARVDEAERDAHPEPDERAEGGRGPHQHEQGRGVGQEDAEQQQVAELAARGHDDGGVVVADEDEQDEAGEDDAQHAEGGGDEEPEGHHPDVLLG